MKVIVLGAGYATRLYPLTRDRAKPLLEVGGLPILSRILTRTMELDDLSEIVVVSNDKFAEQFEAWADGFASRVPLRILNDGSRDESDRLGAVGDIAFALRHLDLAGEDWMVVAGDNLIESSFVVLQRAFRAARRPMIVVRKTRAQAGPSRYNEVTLDAEGRVLRFREKPRDPQTGLAAIALYFLTAEAAPLVDRYLREGGEPDAPGHWLEWLVAKTAVAATPLGGAWFDIGNLESLEAARERFRPGGDLG